MVHSPGGVATKISRMGVVNFLSLHILFIFCVRHARSEEHAVKELQFCSFFNNRAPTPQPGLKNCTWFKENSCCLQQEIDNTFSRMKPLKGASQSCQNYVNYLMCYICAPNQNIFYKRERLTVCEDFCDAWYHACGSAILKGSVIRDLYPGGKEFCLSRRFIVQKESCFNFDVSLDLSRGNRQSLVCVPMLILMLLANLCVHINTCACVCLDQPRKLINAWSCCGWPKQKTAGAFRTSPEGHSTSISRNHTGAEYRHKLTIYKCTWHCYSNGTSQFHSQTGRAGCAG